MRRFAVKLASGREGHDEDLDVEGVEIAFGRREQRPVDADSDTEVRSEIALACDRKRLLESEQALPALVEGRAPAQIVEREPASGSAEAAERRSVARVSGGS